ncbi:MAG: dihydrofolate reductase family protein [Tessaracoccus sp.]
MAQRVHHLAISLDGYATGEGQSLEAPFGHVGGRLMEWFFDTPMGSAIHGGGRVAEGIDAAFVRGWGDGIGVEIMGRNKFTPSRGSWPDDDWKGWWGDNPPFHTPVIVLTHHPRPALAVGDTTFYFLDATPHEAVAAAKELAPGDIRIGGGPTTVKEFLAADLVDYLHFVVVPIIVGRGVNLWDGLEGIEANFSRVESITSPSGVIHVVMSR